MKLIWGPKAEPRSARFCLTFLGVYTINPSPAVWRLVECNSACHGTCLMAATDGGGMTKQQTLDASCGPWDPLGPPPLKMAVTKPQTIGGKIIAQKMKKRKLTADNNNHFRRWQQQQQQQPQQQKIRHRFLSVALRCYGRPAIIRTSDCCCLIDALHAGSWTKVGRSTTTDGTDRHRWLSFVIVGDGCAALSRKTSKRLSTRHGTAWALTSCTKSGVYAFVRHFAGMEKSLSG